MACDRNRIRILLVAGPPLVSEALADVLGQEPEFCLVGQCDRPAEALRLATDHPPHVVLLGCEGRLGISAQLVTEFSKAQPPAKVLALAYSLDDKAVRRLVRLGVRGIISRERPLEELFRAIRAVAAGKSWFELEHLIAVLRPGRRWPGGTDRAPLK